METAADLHGEANGGGEESRSVQASRSEDGVRSTRGSCWTRHIAPDLCGDVAKGGGGFRSMWGSGQGRWRLSMVEELVNG